MLGSGTVSALLLRPVLGATAAVRGGERAVLDAIGLTREAVADQDAFITAAQLRDAWRALAAIAGPDVALRVAAAAPVGAFGLVEYLCRSAETVEEALRRWVRYLNLLDGEVDVALVTDDELGETSLEVVVESRTPAPHAHELCFGLVARQLRELAGDRARSRKVELSHALGGALEAYTAFFGCPVEFGAPRCRLVLPSRALRLPLASADPNLLALLERQAEALSARDPQGPPMTAQVRRILCRLLRDGDPDIGVVAARLGLTARSLQRRLKDEGTTFQLARDDVRRELAARYLESGLAIAEISFLLGFSEPSAFFRAYKRWTGSTPASDRASAALH